MIIAVLAVGWFLLAPKDYEELGRSVRYQVTFVSNILFMRQDGYFDVASDLKPLLHTWSLAVEEQFYIFFPLLLTLLSSRLKHWRLALFAVLLVSFGLSVWAIPSSGESLLPAADACLGVAGRGDAGDCAETRLAFETAGRPGLEPAGHGVDPAGSVRLRQVDAVPGRPRCCRCWAWCC
jgi:hypothetical protein